MFCKNCGTQINSDDKFCTKCGLNLQKNNVVLQNNEHNENIKILEKKYQRKKWVTIVLFLVPFTALIGIHHFYNKRYLRGILYISLLFIFSILDYINIFNYGFFISIIVLSIILYLFISDLKWIIKLPSSYYVNKKYNTKIIMLYSLIPFFLILLNNYISIKNIQKIPTVKTNQTNSNIIDELGLSIDEEEKFIKAINELGIQLNQIININYDPILEGMYTYSINENPNGTEDGYRVSLSNGKKISVYVDNGKFLAIYYLNDFVYENDKLIKQLKQVDDELKIIENNLKNIKVAETVKTLNKEITINSIDFKNEVYPPKRDGYYNYYKANNGEIYLHISVSAKNLEKQAIFCDEIMDIIADYNNGYSYYAFSTVEDDTLGFTYSNIKTIDPLTTKNIHYLISFPKEVQTNTNAPLILKFIIDNQEYNLKLR